MIGRIRVQNSNNNPIVYAIDEGLDNCSIEQSIIKKKSNTSKYYFCSPIQRYLVEKGQLDKLTSNL